MVAQVRHRQTKGSGTARLHLNRAPHLDSTKVAASTQMSGRSYCQLVYVSTSHSNCSITISGFDPNRSGGPQVPAPLEVNTCILPILLNPYTNWR